MGLLAAENSKIKTAEENKYQHRYKEPVIAVIVSQKQDYYDKKYDVVLLKIS